MKNKNLFIALFLVPVFALSQTREERAKIASFSDQAANQQLIERLKLEDQQNETRLAAYFAANPEQKRIITDGFNKTEIVGMSPSGELIFAKTTNDGAAVTARAKALYSGGALGVNIQGQNMIAGIWDGGSVRTSHQEFMVGGVSKVTLLNPSVPFDGHATHVGGTIAAQGIESIARGLAFNASLRSYDWNSDTTEMASEASQGLLVSNHSYSRGSLGSLWYYGAYDSRARTVDEITFNNPYYLPVMAAGNDRGNTVEEPQSTQNTNKFGYDLIFGAANAKNAMTVGAVMQVNNYVNEDSVEMSSFSSWGPTDDGRIKPDITTKGVGVYSSYDSNDTSYATMPGTSMASPGVTGVVTLLQQYHNQLYSTFMRAATVKGVILHNGDEAGYNVGPDYEYGWGLINARKAAETIRDKNVATSGSMMGELSLAQGATFTKQVTANGTGPLKVSISWTDPAAPFGIINSGTVDPQQVYLVNDLDVKVTSAAGTVYYPWKLDGMANFGYFNPASNNSPNNVDNFERVDINNPSGNYTITVTHKGTLVNNLQNFSLIVTGPGLTYLSANEVAAEGEKISIYPNPATKFVKISNAVKGSKVHILDMSGSIVKKLIIENEQIDVQSLATGNYILVYSGKDGKEASFKFIKK